MSSTLAVTILALCIRLSFQTHYTSQWAIRVDGDDEVAKRVAREHGFRYLGPILPGYHHLLHPEVSSASPHPSPRHQAALLAHPEVTWAEQQVARPRVQRAVVLNDPLWPQSWHLQGVQRIYSTRRHGKSTAGILRLDMRVRQAWEMGYTGKGVVVTVVDDGLETDHPDLRANYDPSASYDVCDEDPDPSPRQDAKEPRRHGTRCAGEVAAAANNSVCAVGVAFRASIGAVRFLDCPMTDATEARALSWRPQHVDVYVASWGPPDDGRTFGGADLLTRAALRRGATVGRGGKGSIYVWASGNGGVNDSCNADSFANSVFTLVVGSVSERGAVPPYVELCAAALASTFSRGLRGDRAIVTTDLGGGCTDSHSGTSASAPLAAGIVALTLEANPELTWRDVQHLVVETARWENLAVHDWTLNGAGRKVSHFVGFGLMDAAAMVTKARNWTSVPELHGCTVPGSSLAVASKSQVLTVTTGGCVGTEREVRSLEYVQVKLTLTTGRRGASHVTLVSPAGTRSTLLARRPRDESQEGLTDWTFSTARCWGEDPKGDWTLEVSSSGYDVTVERWTLILTGTASPPVPEGRRRRRRRKK